MKKNASLILLLTSVMLLSGCSSIIDNYSDDSYDDYSDDYYDDDSEQNSEQVAEENYVEPVQPVVPPPQPVPVQNLEVMKALSELAEIKEELKNLRNSVEEIQFETENAKRRQQDLFKDLDRRMVSVERNQSVLNPQPVITLSEVPTGGDAVINDDGTVVQNDQDGSIISSQGSSDDGLITQVAVAGSNSNNPLSVDQDSDSSTDESSSGNTTLSAVQDSEVVTLQEQEAYDGAFEMLKQSRYEDAILQFQQLADTWPQSQLADDAWYWMSEARYVNREFEYALSGFRTIVSRYPDSQRVPEALLKVGYIQYDIGAYEDAAETFRDILARFPGHQVTVSAQTRLRRIENTIQ